MSTTSIRERPLLYSGPMVRAILDGTKTQTRRSVRVPGLDFIGPGGCNGPNRDDPSCWGYADEHGDFWTLGVVGIDEPVIPCPIGRVGDRLWVREMWCMKEGRFGEDGPDDCWYAADGVHVRAVDDDGFQRYRKDGTEASPWQSSRFMPRWASRITLEITGVRVERVRSISYADCAAEGIPRVPCHDDSPEPSTILEAIRGEFRKLWDSTNPEQFAWNRNPWTWAITFRRLEPETGRDGGTRTASPQGCGPAPAPSAEEGVPLDLPRL